MILFKTQKEESQKNFSLEFNSKTTHMLLKLYILATRSTDLFEGPQNKICLLDPPFSTLVLFILSNKYINFNPVYVFPVPMK